MALPTFSGHYPSINYSYNYLTVFKRSLMMENTLICKLKGTLRIAAISEFRDLIYFEELR